MVDTIMVEMSLVNYAKLMKMIEDREHLTGRAWTLDELLDSVLWGMY
jgi:hypothetical protein